MEANGPYIIEDFRFVRNTSNPKEGILLLNAAGGEEFAVPMSVNEARARFNRVLSELGDP